MTPADLDAVNRIDRDAFDTYRRQQHQLVRTLRLRTYENMLTAMQRPLAGVVVEWPPGVIVGYCFTHIWGSLGWLGTLGVAPRSQGTGLGRTVITAGLDLLRQAGCNVLALETMPESGKNLALYTRLGLESRYMTLLCKAPPKAVSDTRYEFWQGDDSTLPAMASCLVPGMDPTPAARWLVEEDAGDTLIWREQGRPVAFAILRTGPRRMDGIQSYITVEAAGCLPEAAAQWPRYLRDMQAFSHRRAKSGLVMPVNAAQRDLLHAFLEQKMQIIHTRVRMISGPELGTPDAILLLTLAM